MSDRVVQAVRDGNLAELRALRMEGADFDEVGTAHFRNEAGDERSWSGLPLSAAIRQPEVLAFLLDAGASMHARDRLGRTPLHVAAALGGLEATRIFLARGADPNARDRSEGTPLHCAALIHDAEDAALVALALLAAGGDPRAKNAQRRFPGACGANGRVKVLLQREAQKKSKPGASKAASPARESLRTDVERRIDDACRVIARTTATHDRPRERDSDVLVYRIGKAEFARIERDAGSFSVREAGAGWRAIPFAELPTDLAPMIEESVRIAQRPVVRAGPAARPHPILKGALDKALPEERPPEPPQLGGYTPVCPAIATYDLTVWMAEEALAILPSDEGRAILALAARKSAERDDLTGAATAERHDSESVGVARRVAGARLALVTAKHDLIWIQARAAGIRMVPLLRRAGRSVTEFLRELDQRILIVEMTAVAARQAKLESLAIERVLWRENDLYIGALADGRFAFVGKVGRKWTHQIGTRDEALACVPDWAFEAATQAM